MRLLPPTLSQVIYVLLSFEQLLGCDLDYLSLDGDFLFADLTILPTSVYFAFHLRAPRRADPRRELIILGFVMVISSVPRLSRVSERSA